MASGSIVEGLKRIGAADAVIGLAKEDQEANEEAIAIRNLVSAVSVPFFQESVATQELTDARAAVTRYIGAEMLDSVIQAKVLTKVKPEERSEYFSNPQYAKVLTGAKQSEYKALGINSDVLIDSRVVAREALAPVLEELLEKKLKKSSTFQKLSGQQLDRIKDLGLPVILSALIDQARDQFRTVAFPEIDLTPEEVDRMLKMTLPELAFNSIGQSVTELLSSLLDDLSYKAKQGEKVFIDEEQALLEVEKEIGDSIFDKPFSWSLREISDQAVERYFELRLAGPKDFFFPRDAQGNRHFDLKRGIPTALGALLIIGIIATACNNPGPDNTPNTPPPTDDDHHETPTIIPGGSTPEATITPVPQILDGSLVLDVGSFPGAPPGVGGPDGGTATPYTESMRSLINTQGFGVVYAPNELGGPGQNLISVENNQICFAPIPDHLFAPYLGPEEQIFPLFEKQTAWGVVPFGTRDGIIHEQVITSFKIPDQFPADQYNCLMGYALEDNPYHIAAGSLTALIIDENGNVAAWADIGYDADAKISHQSDVTPVVDGKALKWEILPSAVVTPSETPTIITTEGKLYPTEWDDRFVIDMTNGFDYDKLSEILTENGTKILGDTTQPVLVCTTMPSSPENNQTLTPSRERMGFSYANIGAVYEIQLPEGISYVVTITCKGSHPSEVLPKAVNFYLSYDLANSAQAKLTGNPNYLYDYIQYLLSTRNTEEIEGLRVAIWGSASFDIPTRPDSQDVANTAYAKGFMPIFGRFIYGNLVQDPAFPETTDAGAIEALSPNLIVVHSIEKWP